VSAVAIAEEEQTVRLLAGLRRGRALTLDEHLAAYGRPAPAGDLVAELEAAGLGGRGGAGFPTAAKLRAVAARRGRPVVVVNGAEGEPLSAKDKLLLGSLPHLVLDGAVALAGTLGATEVVIAHSAAARAEQQALDFALAERVSRGLHPRLAIRRVALPDTYVAGQETALVSFLNGGPALPSFTPPRPFERGVGGRPTLVQNVETVAHAALVACHGAAWFAGAETALFTVTGAVGRPGVYEARLGTPLARLVADAGGLTRAPRAVLVGGYAGAWIDARDARALTLDEAALRRVGGTLGVGAVAVLPEGVCGVCETTRIVRYLADESAGQCGPCVHGLAAIAGRLERPQPGVELLSRWAGDVSGRGACRHPDGAARLVASALSVFRREVEGHDPRRCKGSAW
jgi:NADH:ubiquinone oxidoreductase subunit F (NADH-binding)